ncbi:Transcription elongation factor spt6 [Coemansia sp. RSA 1200]|nr:Transcription elongation factor spt6 [Coemansia sp. RSA 1200]
MSDTDDYQRRSRVGARHGVRDNDEDDGSEGGGSYDGGRRRDYSDEGEGDSLDDDDDEDDEDDDNDEDLRRDGFLVDDDDVEEGAGSDSEERRRRRRLRRKKRRLQREEGERRREEDEDLDEDDLALVAENTYQGSSHAEPSGAGSRFKRLKRGRASKSSRGEDDDDEDLRAELADLVDNGEDDTARGRGGDAYADVFSGEDDGARRGYRNHNAHDDDLGLFGNDNDSEIDEHDYRSSRRRGRAQQGYADDNAMDTGNGDSDMADDADDGYGGGGGLGDGARSRRGQASSTRELGGALGNMAGIVENMDSIDEDMWMELQDIFGDGEEYAFAMEGPQPDMDAYKEKTLADVFEPAELEAKMMTQRDEDIRTTDIPERMQMRATESDSLRPLTEDEIEEETTWIVRQLHAWLTRQEHMRAQNVLDQSAEDNNDWGAGDGSGDGDGNGGLVGSNEDSAPMLFKEADFVNERFLAAVLSVLKLLSQDFFEVPFIARHRREVLDIPESQEGPGNSSFDDAGSNKGTTGREWLSIDDLWKLYDLDQQFRGFLSFRRYLENMIRRLKGEGIDEDYGTDSISTSIITPEDVAYAKEMVSTAGCVEDVTDIIEWLQVQYSQHIRSWAQQRTKFKRVRNFGLWEQLKREGIDLFIRRIGITPRQFGENISTPGKHVVEDQGPLLKPADFARELVGTNFTSPDLVIKAAKISYAQLIALDPQVRRFVRTFCDQSACIIVRPTDAGLREIVDEEHPAFEFKFLRQKPVAAFISSSQFLGIEKAVEDGLLRMAFSLTNEYKFDSHDMRRDRELFEIDRERTARVICGMLETHLVSDKVHGAAEIWNKLRADSLFVAVNEYLLPQMWREITQKLHQQAFDILADSCRRSLEKRIDVQPARNSQMHTGDKPRVVVVAGGGFDASARGALRVVYVDEHGKYKEGFSADSMRKQSGMMTANGDGINGLLDLLGRQTVDVVAVAGMNLQTKRLFEDVNEVVNDHRAHASNDILVTYANDEAARLWWDCEQARNELPNLRKEERYCVCVARTLQDSAVEYASLGKDVMLLHLHKNQRNADADLLFPIVERAYVNVVNKTGVDINEIASHPHKQAVLQYVCGLGPRKASGIINKIGFGDRPLESRSDLVVRRLCTRTVFVNCASFLRIRPPTMDILDDTRIHPEDYDLARKMALDALDIEDDVEDEATSRRGRKKTSGPSRYVAEVMRKCPEKLDDLDLEKYAEELEKLLGMHKLETLKCILHEMQHPDYDPRQEFHPPDDKKVLEMFTGEIVGETIKEDGSSVVSGTIVRVQPRFAIARLDSGLEGFISIGNVADYRIEGVSDILVPGQAIVAVVKRVDLEKMSLDLSMRKSDVDEACGRGRRLSPDAKNVDKYFDIESETLLRDRAKKQQQRSITRTRTIPHPLFKPLNGREAERYLAGRPRGDCVIRISSRGIDHIAVTWKVGEGLFQHIDIKEKGKPNDAALGESLVIGDSAYSDLDELIAYHVEPIARKLEEVKRSPKYYDPETDPLYASEPVASILGTNDYSDDYKSRRQNLWETRVARHLDTLAQSTGRGSYCFSLSLTKPGALVLAFKPTPTHRGITKWTVRVEPKEYRIGDRGRYPDVNGLIVGFKSMQTNPAGSQQRHGGSSRDSRLSASHDDSRSRSYRSHGGSSRNGGGAEGSGWNQPMPSSSMPSANWNSSAANNSSSGWDM